MAQKKAYICECHIDKPKYMGEHVANKTSVNPKSIFKKLKTHSTDKQKIFAQHIHNKGQIYGSYEEWLNLGTTNKIIAIQK